MYRGPGYIGDGLLNFGHNNCAGRRFFGGVDVRLASGVFGPIALSGDPIVVFGNCIRFLTKRRFPTAPAAANKRAVLVVCT